MNAIRARGTVPLVLLVSACGGAPARNLTHAQIDTLPGGVVRVSSAGPTAWSDSSGGRLVEEGRFRGEDGTPSELGEPRSIAVDGAGRIYVVDSKPALVKVFAPDGKLVRTIGREGEGPGEFRVGFIATHGEYLVLHDPQVARTSVFDTAGTFIRSWHSSCCYWSDILVDRQGRINLPTVVGRGAGASRSLAYVRWSLEGSALDTVWVPVRETAKLWTVEMKSGGKMVSSMVTSVPLLPETTHALHPDGGFVYGWTGEYQIVRSPTGADTTRLFGREWTPDPVSDARRSQELETRVKEVSGGYAEATVRSAFRLEDIPRSFPAFLNLHVDPAGKVWVRRHQVADTTGTAFDVFDSTGAWLGPVSLPFKVSAWGRQAWTADGVVALIEDEEGRPTVVRLRLQR